MRALEQHANFRVRLAVEHWLAARHLAPDKRELVRSRSVDSVEAALLDLDLLCRRAPTLERLNLLGSAYKRLALLEVDASKQLEALVNMAQHYHLSLARQNNAYAYTNWLAATLLALQRGATLAVDAKQVQHQISEHQRELNQHLAEDPNFWDAASLADLSLSSLLLRGAGKTRARPKLSAGEAAAPVVAAYRAAIGRSSSPREQASLTENLDFLILLWSAHDKTTVHILEQLRESLT